MIRALIIFFCVVGKVLAVSSIEQDFTCPFDGHRWKQRMETSANMKGMRLDLRQLGDVVQPPTLPQCPKCRAVLFLDLFPPEIVSALRPFVESRDFAQAAGKYPSYHVFAQMQEWLKAPAYYIGHSYLRASWQSEDKPLVARKYLAFAHRSLSAAFEAMKTADKNYANTALLLGELERRLGRLEAADARFRSLMNSEPFKEAGHQRIITRQMELIANRDTLPRAIFATHDALVTAPSPNLAESKPARAGTVPFRRIDDAVPQSFDSISAGGEKPLVPKSRQRAIH